MKCTKCDGKGTVLKIIYEDWQKDEIVRSAVKCPRCNGTGEVNMTNEEWLKSLNTEQLAEWIVRIVDCEFCPVKKPCKKQPCKKQIEKWLKQPHKGE